MAGIRYVSPNHGPISNDVRLRTDGCGRAGVFEFTLVVLDRTTPDGFPRL
jgi:hypothetical protein